MGAERTSAQHGLLGRAAELDRLASVLASAAAGEGRLVLVEGPAGIGKSALVDVAAHEARVRGLRVLRGRSWDDASAPAYWPWTQVVRGLEPDADGPLRALLAPSPPPSGEEQVPRFVLFDAVVSLLADTACRSPLLVVLEDLHGADRASLALLAFVAPQLRALPVLVLATTRPAPGDEVLGALAQDADVLTLDGLGRDDLARLVQDVAELPATPQLVTALHEATGGNPYHVREALRLLRAEGGLRLSVDGEALLPPSVGQALLRRLAPLGDDVRDVLEAAAVLGREFDLQVLSALTGRSVPELLRLLDVAAAHAVVAPVEQAPDRLAFLHALARDAVHAAVPLQRRVTLHARAGEVLEEAGADHEQLAHHFRQAAPLDGGRRAFAHTVAAAQDALARQGYEHVDALVRSALALVPPGTPPPRLGELHVLHGTALMRAGDLAAGRDAHLQAVSLARDSGDTALLAQAALGYGAGPVEGGLVDATLIALLEEALESAHAPGVRARLLARLAHELLFSPDSTRRQALGREALALLPQVDDPAVEAEVLRRVIGASIGPDTAQECLAMTDQLLALARRAHVPELEAEALARRCNWLLEQGRGPELNAAAERVAELAARTPQPQVRWFAAVLGVVRTTLRGRFEQAREDADRTWSQFAVLPNAAGAWTVCGLTGMTTVGVPEPSLEPWEDVCRSLMQARPGIRRPYAAGLAVLLADAGRAAEARQLLAGLVGELADLPRDGQHVTTLTWAATATWLLADAELAAPLLEALRPFSGRHAYVSMAVPVAYNGPVDLSLAQLAVVLGQHDDAARWSTRAAEQAAALDAVPWLPVIWLAHAQALAGRGAPGDGEQRLRLLAEARRVAEAVGGQWLTRRVDDALGQQPCDEGPALLDEGEWWTVAYGGRTTRHRAGKGFRYLRLLLEHPGREMHVLELVAAVEGVDRRQVQADGDTGPLLDERARAAYRRRLEELRDEVEDAEAAGDAERCARARAEFEFLTDELRSALGLGGRDRRAGGHAEQARSSVTKLLRRLMERLEPEQPELVRHLRATLRTGAFCGYGDEGADLPVWRLHAPQGQGPVPV